MDAVSSILPAITSLRTVQSLFASQGTSAISLSATAGLISTYVDISQLGQVYATASAFQDAMRALQAGSASGAGGLNFGTDFASLAAEAQYLVDSYNTTHTQLRFLASTGTSGLPLDLGAALATRREADLDNGESALTRLEQLGIRPADAPGGPLQLDLQALQNAHDSDPAGAFSLLGRAADGFADAIDEAIGSDTASGATAIALNLLAGTSPFGSNALFGTSAGTATGTLDLFALAALGRGVESSLLARTQALSQYALVSSLLA